APIGSGDLRADGARDPPAGHVPQVDRAVGVGDGERPAVRGERLNLGLRVRPGQRGGHLAGGRGPQARAPLARGGDGDRRAVRGERHAVRGRVARRREAGGAEEGSAAGGAPHVNVPGGVAYGQGAARLVDDDLVNVVAAAALAGVVVLVDGGRVLE